MKLARLLATTFLLGAALAAPARAGTEDTDGTDNPAIVNPDATPRAYTAAAHAQLPQQDPARAKEAADRAEQNKDWLLDSYEQELQERQAAEGQGDQNNIYTEVTSSRELARAAGLSPTAADTPAPADLRTGTGASPQLTLRPDGPAAGTAPATDNNSAPGTDTGLQEKPVAPLAASALTGLHDLFSSLPALSAQFTPKAAAADPDVAMQDPAALDVPGMVAAESDPAKKAELDLNLDALPDESAPPERPSHELALELPSSSNADRLQKVQDAAMLAPGTHRTEPPAPINPILLRPPPSDTSAMVPEPSPIRGQVDDPYDILR